MECIFCKIIDGTLPSKTVYENEYVKVIMNIHPVVNGHLLIIPKKHFDDFKSLDNEYLIHINQAVKTISDLIMNKLHVNGLSISVNYGDKQEIKHYHVHIIPNDKTKIKDIDAIYQTLKN